MRTGADAQKYAKYMKRALREVQPKAGVVLQELARKNAHCPTQREGQIEGLKHVKSDE